MTTPLKEHFAEARYRLLEVMRLAMPSIVKVTTFADTGSVVTPYAEIVIPTLNLNVLATGKQDITINAEIRLWCGTGAEGFDGQLQDTMFFDWMPSITQSFIEYSNLCYPDKPQRIGALDTARTGFQRAQVLLTNNEWLMVFYWQLVFTTGYKKAIGV